MNPLSLPVVHPSFQQLRNSGRLLHFLAAILIITHALTHSVSGERAGIYFWCQLIVALDIIILVTAGRGALQQWPRLNLFFRLVEILFFAGIATIMLLQGHYVTSVVHLVCCSLYIYLFYCERRLDHAESIGIFHSGISIPTLNETRFLLWSHVNNMDASYDGIIIQTSFEKTYQFNFRHNLQFEELEQIHEFCRHYLGSDAPSTMMAASEPDRNGSVAE